MACVVLVCTCIIVCSYITYIFCALYLSGSSFLCGWCHSCRMWKYFLNFLYSHVEFYVLWFDTDHILCKTLEVLYG